MEVPDWKINSSEMNGYLPSRNKPTYMGPPAPGPQFQNGFYNSGFPEVVFRNGSSSFPSFQCSWTQKNMPPSFVVPQSPLSVVSSHWPSFPMSYPSDGFINRKGMKATQSLEQAGNTHREQGFPSQACWTSYGDNSFLTPVKLENTPRRADEASSLVQAMQSQGMRPPNHSLFNDTPVSFGASEQGEVRLDRGSPFPAREHEGRHAPLKCGHDIDEPGARLLREQYNEVLGIKDTMKTSAAEEINLFKERNGYGPVPHFLSPPAKVIPEIQLVKSQNNVRPEVCKSTDVSQFLPLRQLSSSMSGEDPRLLKNLSEPGFPESHYFLLTQLAKGSKVDKALQFDSRETEKQHSTGRELSSYDLEPKADREPEAFAITPKGKVMYLLKRNARPEDLEGKVEGDVKDDDVYEIVCFHEVREQGRLILHKGSLYQEVGKVISSKSPQHSVTQGSTPVTSKMKGEEESEITCGGIQKKPATALQEGWQPKVDTAVQCGMSCAGGAPELYEEDSDVQDEYEHLSDDASTKSLSC